MYRNFTKPIFDVFSSLLLLIIFLPFIFVTGLILFCANSREILFIQQRPGLNSKSFGIIKFKTMRDIYDEEGELIHDELRLTKMGSF